MASRKINYGNLYLSNIRLALNLSIGNFFPFTERVSRFKVHKGSYIIVTDSLWYLSTCIACNMINFILRYVIAYAVDFFQLPPFHNLFLPIWLFSIFCASLFVVRFVMVGDALFIIIILKWKETTFVSFWGALYVVHIWHDYAIL